MSVADVFVILVGFLYSELLLVIGAYYLCLVVNILWTDHLNFKNVDHIDSTGIGFLLEIRHALIERKGKIGLFSINEYIRDIFDITNIDTLIHLYAHEEEALIQFPQDG